MKSPEFLSTEEITQSVCVETCLNSPNVDDLECWAVAHLPGYIGNDCRIFNSFSPEYCVINEGSFSGVSLFIKKCFEGTYIFSGLSLGEYNLTLKGRFIL